MRRKICKHIASYVHTHYSCSHRSSCRPAPPCPIALDCHALWPVSVICRVLIAVAHPVVVYPFSRSRNQSCRSRARRWQPMFVKGNVMFARPSVICNAAGGPLQFAWYMPHNCDQSVDAGTDLYFTWIRRHHSYYLCVWAITDFLCLRLSLPQLLQEENCQIKFTDALLIKCLVNAYIKLSWRFDGRFVSGR